MECVLKKLIILSIMAFSFAKGASSTELSGYMDDSYDKPLERSVKISIQNKGWYLASAVLSYYSTEMKEIVYQNIDDLPMSKNKDFYISQGVLYVYLEVFYKDALEEAKNPVTIFST